MSRRFPQAGLAFVALVVLASFHDLGGRNLHDLDTSRWGQLAREMIRSGEWLVPTRYGELYVNKPPLYLWLVAGPSWLAGEVTPFLTRLPSALGLALLVFSTAWWTRLRTGDRAAGRIAGLLLVSTFGIAWLGRAGRLDMWGSGLSVAAAALLDAAALGRGGRAARWGAGLLLGAALLTKGPPLLLVPLAALFTPSPGRSLRERLRAARPLRVLALGVAVALLWFVPAVLQAGWAAYGHPLLVGQAADRIEGTLGQGRPATYYLGALAVQYAPWGPCFLALALASLLPRVRRSLGAVGGFACAGLVLLVVFTLIPTKHHRYLAPVLPLLAMPWAWSIARWTERGAFAARATRILAVVCALDALAVLVLGFVEPHALLPLLPPALGLAGLAAWLWRRAPRPDGRARLACGLLAALALALLSVSVARPRLYLTTKERFNLQLEELRAGGVPVWIAHGMTPENVFHGAPDARWFLELDEPVPPGRVLVVCNGLDAARLRAADGSPGRVLAGAEGENTWTILGFGYP